MSKVVPEVCMLEVLLMVTSTKLSDSPATGHL